jgi:3-(3-hydroxy-phenyl)propionate hydroxylase
VSGAKRRETLVVGAGPVGLTCALALRSRGIEVAVLEAQPESSACAGSRAIYTHRASLELLERIRPGLGWQIAREGLVWPAKRTYWRGREVYAHVYPPPRADALPPFASLPQTAIERLLGEACAESGVELVRGVEVERLTVERDGVEARARTDPAAGGPGNPAGPPSWSARYLVGADGARSVVRRELGLAMRGGRSENTFVVVDVSEDPERPTPPARIFHYQHPGVGGRNVLLVPFAGGWRADLQCRPGEAADGFASSDGAARWIAAVLGERYAPRITWVSSYRFLLVVASSLADRRRRVLLTGDAAHLFAPFGARGMNSGIADAYAAAGAIAQALVAGGEREASAAIDRFAAERRRAALANCAASASALAAMQSRRPAVAVKRRLAAAFARRSPRAGAWLDAAPYGPRLREGRGGGY